MNTMVRSAPNAEAVRYPDPCIPMLPTMSLSMRDGPSMGEFDSRFLRGDGVFLPSGRCALALAMQSAGIGAGDAVLLPAYHCGSMLAPVRWCGAEPVLYNLQPDLHPDPEDVLRKLEPRVRALVVVHFFGFPVDLTGLRALCDERGIILIEDCAHAFFGHDSQPLPGSAGDFAIASTRKFFPGADGGMLIANRQEYKLDVPPSPAAGLQIKASMACIQQAANADKLGAMSRPLSHGLAVLDRLRGRNIRSASQVPAAAGADEGADNRFDPAELKRQGRSVSRWLIKRSNPSRVAARRRANYAALQAGLADVPGTRLVYDHLPDTVVPYVFPWLLAEPQTQFSPLKMARVPMYRWEVLMASECSVSADYQFRLIQLPCHQEINAAELDWLIGQCRKLAETN